MSTKPPPEQIHARAFALHRRLIESVAARILGDRDAAADVASETYLALHQNGPRDPDALLPWLLTTSRNRAIDHARSRERGRRREQRAAGLLAPLPDQGLEEPYARRQAAGLVARAYERLGARDRAALRARFVEEVPYEAIAAELGCTPAQARVIVHRATKRLRAETTALLVALHAKDDACKSVAGGRPVRHGACGACDKILDELISLPVPGLVAAGVPVWARLADRLLRPRPRVRTPGVDRLAEAVVAVVVVVASPGLQQAASPALDAAEVIPRVVESSRPTQRGIGDAVGTVVERARRTVAAAPNAVEAVDGADDVGDLSETVETLGMPVFVTDAADRSLSKPIDIRKLSIGAQRAREGVELVSRIELAAQPSPASGYAVRWGFKGRSCWAFLNARPSDTDNATAALRIECNIPITGGLEVLRTASGAVSADVEGRALTIVIRLWLLDGRSAELLRPGAIIRGIEAVSGDVNVADTHGDIAPDYGKRRMSYKIPS